MSARSMAGTGFGIVRSGAPALATVMIQGLSSLSSLLVTWYLVRRIGLAGFGYYSVYLVVATTITTVAGAYVLQPLNSLASQLSGRRTDEYVRSARVANALVLAAMVLVGCAAMAGLAAAGFGSGHALAVTALSVTMCIGEFHRRVLFLRGNRGGVLAYDLLRYVLIAAAFLALTRLMPVADAVVYALAISATYVLARLPSALVGMFGARVPFAWGRLWVQMRRLHRSGKHLAVGALMRFVSTRLPILASFFILGAFETGLIRVSQTIVALVNPAVQAMEYVVPVWLGRRIREGGFEAAIPAYRQLSRRLVALFVPIYLVICLASPVLLVLMGVEATAASMGLVAGFSAISMMVVAQTLLIFELRARERANIVSSSLSIGAIVVIVSTYPALTVFGLFGVVIPIIGAQILGLYMFRKALRSDLRRKPIAETR